MALDINKLQYKFYPAYNPGWYEITLLNDSVSKTNYGRMKLWDYTTTTSTTPVGHILDFISVPRMILAFRIFNDYINDTAYYPLQIQPSNIDEVPLMLPAKKLITSEESYRNLLIVLRAMLNSYTKVFNQTLLGNYFKFTYVLPNSTYADFIADNRILRDNCYIEFVPRNNELLRLSLSFIFDGNATNAATILDFTVNTTPEDTNKINQLMQPRLKVDILTNDVKFPDITDVTNPSAVTTEYFPIRKNSTGEYKIQFDVNKIMKKFVKTKLPINNGIRFQDTWLKRYWLNITEEGTCIVKNRADILPSANRSVFDLKLDSIVSEPRFVSNSARDLLKPVFTNIYYRDNTACLPGGAVAGTTLVNFLTDQPKQKNTYYCQNSPCNSKEYLSFIVEIGNALITANVRVTYNDNTSTSFTKTYLDKSVGGQAITIDVSPEVLGIDKLVNQDIYKWEISFTVGTEAYTVVQEYIRKPCGLPNTYNVIFLNQLGMWDSFQFIGDNNSATSFKTNKYRGNIAPGTTSSTRVIGNFNTMFLDGYELNSNQINSEHYEWLKQLAISPDFYIVFEGKLEAYVIDSVDYKFDSFRSLYTVGMRVSKTIEMNSINNR